MDDPIRQAVKEVLFGRMPAERTTNTFRLILKGVSAAKFASLAGMTREDLLQAVAIAHVRHCADASDSPLIGRYGQTLLSIRRFENAYGGDISYYASSTEKTLEYAAAFAEIAKRLKMTADDISYLVSIIADETGLQ